MQITVGMNYSMFSYEALNLFGDCQKIKGTKHTCGYRCMCYSGMTLYKIMILFKLHLW